MSRADSLKLWDSIRWKKILLYRTHFYGSESDVDGGGFFISPNGKTDPRAEMQATLRGFFHTDIVAPPLDTFSAKRMHPLVKYPLRLRYLQTSLNIPDTTLPDIDRDRFERWIKALNPDQISVVFASAYLGNPASAMGHTFLRVHSRQNAGQRELLDYGINYAGNTPPGENTVLYSLKGMMGFYPGTFGLMPYYVSLQKYLHIENRDLWYYHLNLTEEQQWSLLAHLWELGDSWERYFFFTENCSYFLSSLIDIVLPDSASLMEPLPYAMVPIETIKEMQKIPGFVDSVTWRPSTMSRIRIRYRAMTPQQKELTTNLLVQDTTLWEAAIHKAKLTPPELAFVYDVALEYSLVQKRASKDKSWFPRNASLLRQRSMLHEHATDIAYTIDTTQNAPHRVHAPYRIETGAGAQEYQHFGTIGFRLSYQDANQYDEGLKPNNILEFMDVRLRIWEKRKIHLEYLDILQLANYPTTGAIKSLSASRLDLRLDRPPMEDRTSGNDPLSPYFAFATGKAWDFWGNQALVGYGLLGGRLRLHPEYQYYTNLGPMLNSGIKWRPVRWLSVLARAEMTYNIIGARGWELHHEAEMRVGGPNLEVRLGGSQWNHRNEANMRFLISY